MRAFSFKRAAFLILSIALGQSVFAYEQEEVSFTSRTTKRLFFGSKQFVTDLYHSKRGRIASVVSDRVRSEIKYHFRIADTVGTEGVEGGVAFRTLDNIRTYTDVFGDIGFPQLASLTFVDGSMYGLIWTTKNDLEPEEIARLETNDPKIRAEFYQKLRARTGVSGTYGPRMGGASMPRLPDSAALVKFDGSQPEVLRVYNLKKSSSDDVPVYDVYKIIYELAYADLVDKVRGAKEQSTGCSHRLKLFFRRQK